MKKRHVALWQKGSGYGAQESDEIFPNGFLACGVSATLNQLRKQLDFGDFKDNKWETAG